MPTRERRPAFAEILRRRLGRRGFLVGGAASAALVLIGQPACAAVPTIGGPGVWFEPIKLSPAGHDELVVAAGHAAEPLLRWGDPVLPGAPAFDPVNLSRAAQERQFGYNCDFVGFQPLPWGSRNSDRGLLWVNHEYTLPDLMFPRYDAKNPSRQEVDVAIAAHGGTVVELRRVDGKMVVVSTSPYNRRITGDTPIRISGPAVGHEWMRTRDDPSGTLVRGMLSNCAGGETPWGTVLSCEENFWEYFGQNTRAVGSDTKRHAHGRYGIPEGPSKHLWEKYHPRFDCSVEPNEPFRFGWVVEIDPHDPTAQPVKRTAMGRFHHEGASLAISPGGRLAFYSGDDQPFECVYKFVTRKTYNPAHRDANRDLLDEGTLYAARFKDDGTGEWLPIVFGEGPLTPANDFTSQADVLLKTRWAADQIGATKMDRPEDIQQNPANKKIYLSMSNNRQRGGERRPELDRANPRPDNRWGHVIELTEAGDDVTATTFRWEILLLCGDPADPSTYFAGFPRERVSPIAAPDNLTFDQGGNLWIACDGQPDPLRLNDAVFVVPTAGPQRGNVQPFLSSVAGAETTGLQFTPDNRTLFVSIQHPGEGSTFEKPSSRWPDGSGPPRPSVIQVWNTEGGRVGVTR